MAGNDENQKSKKKFTIPPKLRRPKRKQDDDNDSSEAPPQPKKSKVTRVDLDEAFTENAAAAEKVKVPPHRGELEKTIKNKVYQTLKLPPVPDLDPKWSNSQKYRVLYRRNDLMPNRVTRAALEEAFSAEIIAGIINNHEKVASYLIDPSRLGVTFIKEADVAKNDPKKKRKYIEKRNFASLDNLVSFRGPLIFFGAVSHR